MTEYEKYNDPFFSKIIGQLEFQLTSAGYFIDFAYTVNDILNPAVTDSIHSLTRLDGVIFIGIPSKNIINIFKEKTENIICIEESLHERCYKPEEEQDILNTYDTVTYQSADMIALSVDHLISLGHKKILLIRGSADEAYDVRLSGYKKGLSRNGIEFDKNLVYSGKWEIEDGYNLTREALGNTDFSAIICCNDKMALGAINCLSQKGIKIPQEVAVMGFDDIDMAQYSIPPLSTVYVPAADLGRMAALTLDMRISGKLDTPICVTLPCKLVIRKSS